MQRFLDLSPQRKLHRDWLEKQTVADEVIWMQAGSQFLRVIIQVQLRFLPNTQAVSGGYSLGLNEAQEREGGMPAPSISSGNLALLVNWWQ